MWILRTALALSTGEPLDYRRSRDGIGRALRASWRSHVEAGRVTGDDVRAGRAWVSRALNLLDQRDRVAHAWWSIDPDASHMFRGHHPPSDANAPDLAGMRRLSDAIRAHVNDRGLVPILTALVGPLDE